MEFCQFEKVGTLLLVILTLVPICLSVYVLLHSRVLLCTVRIKMRLNCNCPQTKFSNKCFHRFLSVHGGLGEYRPSGGFRTHAQTGEQQPAGGSLLAFIALSAAQSSAQTRIHSAILVIDTSNNVSYDQVHWLVRTPYLSIEASNV